jgi:hypothetical protein
VVEGPSADDGWIDYVIDLFDEQEEAGVPAAFPLGPDVLHKDDTSGGDGYELVPTLAIPGSPRSGSSPGRGRRDRSLGLSGRPTS